MPAAPTVSKLGALRASLWHPSAAAMRRWAVAGIVVNVGIVLSGAVVRLTKSGLGCPTWPRCTGDSLVPVPHEGVPVANMAIEFGNRLLSFLVLGVGLACVVAAYRLSPRRRDLTRLALALPLGALAQAVLGGIMVLTGLHPASVAAHFLLSAAIIAAAVGLYERAREGDGPPRPLVRGEIRWLARGTIAAVGVVLVLGTVVTGTGPHAGDPASPRFDFSLHQVAQVHAGAVWATFGLTLALLLTLRLTGAPAAARERAAQLFALVLAQGAIGYTQLFLNLPEGLVWLHILGAVLVWIAAWRVLFALRAREPAAAAVPSPPEHRHAAELFAWSTAPQNGHTGRDSGPYLK